MDIRILRLLEGAKKAEGITVIIDVFRAFTLEAYMFAQNAYSIRPIASLEEARELKQRDPEALLFGERGGARAEGCDFGNSPSSIFGTDLSGKRIIHTTSAGTQGISAAVHAQEILTGSFVNAAATARYIRSRQPDTVCLVAMGNAGIRDTEEDLLCAEYLKALIEESEYPDIDRKLDELRYLEGKKFFDPAQQDRFPQADFDLCIKRDIFDFVIRVEKTENGFNSVKTEKI